MNHEDHIPHVERLLDPKSQWTFNTTTNLSLVPQTEVGKGTEDRYKPPSLWGECFEYRVFVFKV